MTRTVAIWIAVPSVFLLRRVWGTDEHIEPEGQCQQQISIAERFPRRKMGGEPVVARLPTAPCRTFSVLPGQDSSRPEGVPFRGRGPDARPGLRAGPKPRQSPKRGGRTDRKSTRLNSSHLG